MSPLEIVIRTVGATAAVILAIVIARTKGAAIVGRTCGALLCLGVAAYLPCSSAAAICAAPTASPLVLLATGVPFFFWGWTRAAMDDDFQLTLSPLIAAAALMCTPVLTFGLANTRFSGWGIALHSLLGIAFVVLALVEVLRTWQTDLIEARRRLRLILLVVIGGYSVAVLSVELFLQNQPATQALQLINATLLSGLLIGLAVGLLSLSDTLLGALGWLMIQPQQSVPTAVEPAVVETRDAEQELIDKLRLHMTGKAAYRDATFSITQLATTFGVPEKRLRDIINRRLGHKNFPSYVNAFRLEEVRLRLLDSRNDHLPILTLALDAGFGSIVAFNRAFKDKFAVTPSEYRERRRGTVVEPDTHRPAQFQSGGMK